VSRGEPHVQVTFLPATNMKIRAAVARSPNAPLHLEEIDLESPRDNEVLIRLVAVGICHTDIAMRDQVFPVPQPIVLGHEGAGVVEAVGRSVSKLRVGDHVVVSYASCGNCRNCHIGKASYCRDFFGYNFAGRRSDGTTALSNGAETIHSHFFGQSSFATFAVANERNVVKVTKEVPLELLGPLACGIQTGAGAVMNSLVVPPGSSMVVVGVGSVGLSAVMAARLMGVTTIVAVDLLEARLELAATLGATHTVKPAQLDLAAALQELIPGGPQYVLETTGVPEVIQQAVQSLAPLGVCGLLGAPKLDSEMRLNIAHMMTAGRSVRGIIEGDSVPEVFIPTLIELYEQGRFPFDQLVAYFPFEKINEALDAAERGDAIKPIVRIS
jgi:aryl-alcohol dehydrogenase